MQPNGPVMDVQRPRPNLAPTAPADSITSAAPDTGQVVGQTPQATPTPPTNGQPKKKRTGLVVGIITVVVILLIGLGVGGFIWYKSSHKPAPAAAPAETASERVDVEEIDTVTTEIDKTMNTLNDSTDVTPGDVNDSTLGL